MYGGVFEIVLFYLILDEREEKSHLIYLGSGPRYVYVWKYIDLEIERTDHKKSFCSLVSNLFFWTRKGVETITKVPPSIATQ